MRAFWMLLYTQCSFVVCLVQGNEKIPFLLNFKIFSIVQAIFPLALSLRLCSLEPLKKVVRRYVYAFLFELATFCRKTKTTERHTGCCQLHCWQLKFNRQFLLDQSLGQGNAQSTWYPILDTFFIIIILGEWCM